MKGLGKELYTAFQCKINFLELKVCYPPARSHLNPWIE